MSSNAYSGRFRIHSVNSSDILPICSNSAHYSDIVNDKFFDHLKTSVDTQCHLFTNLNATKLHQADLISNCQMDGLFESSCSNLSNPGSVDLMIPLDNTTELYTLHSDSPISVDLHLTSSTQDKQSDESLVTTRKFGKKAEEIIDTGPNGRFLKFCKEIGRGAFKTVYKGLDTETGVAIAWCEINNRRCTRDETVRFKREVEILKKLQHPNILRFYDFFSCANRRGFVLITELMNAGTLRTYLSRFTSIPLRLIKNWCLQILRGLQFLHSREPSIIHRDLKCDNIFINGANGSVKIGDLGLAVLSNSNARTVIGTPEFMAPEMYEEDYDEAVDIWAFGLCVLEMYTQEYPYRECRCPAAIYKRVSEGIRPRALELVKDQDLYNIILCCTEKDISDRVTIPTLLNHELFQEQEIHMEEVTSIGTDTADPDNIKLVLSREQKAITLDFNLKIDNPERVVEELVMAGFVKNTEYDIFVKSLKNRIDKAKCTKYLSLGSNSNEDGSNVVTSNSLPVDIITPVDDCNEGGSSSQENFSIIENGFQELNRSLQTRITTRNSCITDRDIIVKENPNEISREIQDLSRKVRLSLSGINGDKLICFLISSKTTLEFGFSLQEYSTSELVKNMIDNKFILACEQSQFVTQAELLIQLVQEKKRENIRDSEIVEFINSLPCFSNNKHYSEELPNQSFSANKSILGHKDFSCEIDQPIHSRDVNSQLYNHQINHSKSQDDSVHNVSFSDTYQNMSPFEKTTSPVFESYKSLNTTQHKHSILNIDGLDSSTHSDNNPSPTKEYSKISISKKENENCSIADCNDERFTDELLSENRIKLCTKSSDSHIPLSKAQNIPVHNVSSYHSIDDSKQYQNETIPPRHTMPNKFFNSATGNIPSTDGGSIIDSHMSDVLLLAIYKGFQTPQLQTYMNILEKRIFSHLQKCDSRPIHSEFDSKIFQNVSSPFIETGDNVNNEGVVEDQEHFQNYIVPELLTNSSHHISDPQGQSNCCSTQEQSKFKTDSFVVHHISDSSKNNIQPSSHNGDNV